MWTFWVIQENVNKFFRNCQFQKKKTNLLKERFSTLQSNHEGKNKTAGSNQNLTRSPRLLKMLSKRMMAFFQNVPSSSFLIFPILILFSFLQKTLNSSAKKSSSWNNIIYCPFYSKIATFIEFEKEIIFFRKTILFFQREPKFWLSWEILLIPSPSNGKSAKT